MRFSNDHDPLPLLLQIAQRYGDSVHAEHRQREPGMVVDRLRRTLTLEATRAYASGRGRVRRESDTPIAAAGADDHAAADLFTTPASSTATRPTAPRA